MNLLFVGAILLALTGTAYADDSDIRHQQEKAQSDYDAAHPGNHKGCLTPFYARTGEFMGFKTVPDGDQFVGRVTRELRTCRNGQTVASKAAATTAAGNQARRRVTVSGEDRSLDYFYALFADCSSMGYPTINVITPPANGAITSTAGEAKPGYAKDNERAGCNLKKAPVTLLHYASKPGYHGVDKAMIEVLFPLGSYRTIEYIFEVK